MSVTIFKTAWYDSYQGKTTNDTKVSENNSNQMANNFTTTVNICTIKSRKRRGHSASNRNMAMRLLGTIRACLQSFDL